MANIDHIIKQSLRRKFDDYNPETKHMPFHHRLLGTDRMALFSFIHSLNTTFGTSIFQPAAEALAKPHFPFVKVQYVVGNQISKQAQAVIQEIIDTLSGGVSPNKSEDIERIRAVCTQGEIVISKPVRVDLAIQDYNDEFHLFDLKTVKPNKNDFKSFKRTLLEWVAILLLKNPKAKVQSYLAIPYNPYEPKQYQRWTMAGMIDLDAEIKVAEEFWNFLGGENAYQDLLDSFERAGIDMREEIDGYFKNFN